MPPLKEGVVLPTTSKNSRERRWVVLCVDGRFVTLGCASDPSDEEVRDAEDSLRLGGLASWLAIMEGNPYVGVLPRLMEVRPSADDSHAPAF